MGQGQVSPFPSLSKTMFHQVSAHLQYICVCLSLYCWHPQSLIVLLLLFLPYKSLSQILKSHSDLGPPPLRPQLKNPPRFSIAISRVQKSLNVPVLSGPCRHRQPCLILCHSLLLTMSQHLWPLFEMQQAFAVLTEHSSLGSGWYLLCGQVSPQMSHFQSFP